MAFGIDDAIAAGLQIINKFIPDKDAQAKAEAELRQTLVEASVKAESDQRDIDKTEAASQSLFVAGWRPAVGWLCLLTLAYSWMVAPLITYFAQIIYHAAPALPILNNDESQTLLYALLGVGSLRTVDKLTGNATKNVIGLPWLKKG